MESPHEDVWLPGGVRTEFLVRSADTGGAFCLLRDHPPAGWSFPSHLHRRESETIHVLDGDFEIEVDGVTGTMGPGDTVHIPAGTVHRAVNRGARAQRLVVFAPGGMDELFAAIGARSPSERVDLRAAAAAAERHGWRFVPGPVAGS